MQCKPPNIICPMSPSLMHQNMANRKAAGESDALFTADESSSAWHCIPSNEALITCPYHDCKGSLSDPYVGCIDYSHCTEDCSGTASPIILNQCAGVAEDTSKTCDLDPNTDGTALCPSGCESHLCPQPDIVQIQEALRRASLLQQPLRAPGAGAMEAGAMEGSQLQGPGGSQSDLAALVAGLAASTEAGISQSDLAALSAAFAPDLLAAADAQLARGVGGAAAAGAAT